MVPYHSKYKEDVFAVDLKANKNNIEMFPVSIWYRLMRETLSYDTVKLLDTVPFNGLTELRIAIAQFLLEFRGMHVSPDQIIIGAGTEYLYTRLIQLLGRNTVFAVEDPGYHKIRSIYQSNDVAYKTIPLDKEGINMTALHESGSNVLHISPSHYFPLGFVTPVTRRIELLSWANKEKNRYIIEDDYDSEYCYQGIPVPSLYSIDVREKVIYMNTFSKSIAPAVRISYMVLPEALMERYIETMNFYTCSVSSFEQFTMARFISEGYLERHINRMKRFYMKQHNSFIKSIMDSAIAEVTEIIESTSGTHFLLKIITEYSDTALISRLREKKILVSCLSEYCESYNPDYRSTLVINYAGVTDSQIQYFINELSHILLPV